MTGFGNWAMKQAKELQEKYKKEEEEKNIAETTFEEEWELVAQRKGSDGDLEFTKDLTDDYGDVWAIPGLSVEDVALIDKEANEEDDSGILGLQDNYKILDVSAVFVGIDEYNRRFEEWVDD